MYDVNSIRGISRLAILPAAALALLVCVPGHAQTLARIQKAGEINVGFVPDQPPFSDAGADRKPVGYAVELCGHIIDDLKQRLGAPGLAVNYLPASASVGLEMIERKQLDMLCGAVPETLGAREQVSFSIPIYITGIGALVRKDAPASLLHILNGEVARTGPTWRATINAGLANHVFAVRRGQIGEAWVRARIAAAGVIAKVVAVDTHQQGIELLAQKKVDAYFADRAILATYAAKRQDGAELYVIDRRFTLAPVAIALPRGDEDFRLVVDTALSKLYRSQGYVSAYSRHFGKPSETARMLFEANALF